jgi:hypothetical protein
VLTNIGVGVQITPSTNNVNTTSGVAQPTNSYVNSITASGPQTLVDAPGYPGPLDVLDAADTLETIGDDPSRCYLENAPTRYQGFGRLLVLCWSVTGQPLLRRVHAGTWGY